MTLEMIEVKGSLQKKKRKRKRLTFQLDFKSILLWFVYIVKMSYISINNVLEK